MTLQNPETKFENAQKTETIGEAITDLLKRGLVREVLSEDGNKRYKVTPLGLQYLSDFESMRQELEFQPTVAQLSAESHPKTNAVSILRTLSESSPQAGRTHLSRVSLLIPALNESKNIAILLNSLADHVPEIHEIIVVDGSLDETAEVARRLGASVMTQEGNGKGDALRQAFASAYGGDIVVSIDADGSNRIEEIPQLVEAVVNGADLAKGSRFMSGGGSTDLSLIRRIGNGLFVRLVNLIWSAHYTDLCYGFVAFRKGALMTLAPLLESNHFEIETEICIKARKLGLKVVEVPSVELRRRYGSSKLRGVQDSSRIFRTVLHELTLSLKARISYAVWNRESRVRQFH